MTITFEKIPQGILVPGTYSEFDTASGVKSIPGNPRTIVAIAQKTTADSVFPENTVVEVFKSADVVAHAGQGSIAHLTAQAIFKSEKRSTLFMVYQNDAGGSTAASGTITIAGTPTVAGFINIWIGSVLVQVPVATTDTFGSIAAAIEVAIDGEADYPVTASVAAGVVTVTAKNAGLLGNSIPISFEIVGVVGITVVVVQLASGALDPDVQDALDAIFPTHLRHVYCTYNDATALGKLKTFLNDSADPIEKKRKLGWTGSGYLTVGSANSLATTLNDERMEIAYIRYSKTTVQGHSLDYEIGGSNVAEYAIISNPALPRNKLALTNIVPPALEEQLSFNEQQSLLSNGVAPLQVLPGEGVAIVRTVSTRTSTSGVEDFTLLDIQTMDTLDSVAAAMEFMFTIRFARRLINDQLLRTIKSEVLAVLLVLQDLQRLRDVEENKDSIIVEEDILNRGQVNLDVPAEVIPGLHVIAEKITLIIN